MAIPVAPIYPQSISPARLIRLPELMRRTALSRSEIYRRIRSDKRFPKPLKLGTSRCTAFVEAEVDVYLEECIGQRNAKEALL